MKKIALLLSCILGVFVFSTFAWGEERISRPHRFNQIYNQILTDSDYLTLGNPFGKYVIVDFFDYRCPFCQKFHKQMMAALRAGKLKNVRWILIETPIFGDKVNFVAKYVLAAKNQGKYKEFFLAVADRGHLSLYDTKDIARSLGLNLKQLEMDAETDVVIDVFRKNIKLFRKFRTDGVPLLIIDRDVYSGAILDKKLDEILKKAN